jgi:hypothetical protein
MGEEVLSYKCADVQDCPMHRRFKGHTSNTRLHWVAGLRMIAADMNFVTFAECAR